MLPAMEMYSIAIGLVEPYLTGGIIKKDSLIYFGHTDTRFTKMDELLGNREFEWFVWAYPQLHVDADLFHSDAFLLNLSIMNPNLLRRFFLYHPFTQIYEDTPTEPRITKKIKTTSDKIKILGRRRPKESLPNSGFFHTH